MRTAKREKNDNPVVDRIDRLLKEQYKTKRELTDSLGLSHATYTRWRYENGKTYMDHIGAIAEFLGVTPNYLIRGDDGEVGVETLSNEEIELIMNVRQLPHEKRNLIFNNARWILDNNVKKTQENK